MAFKFVQMNGEIKGPDPFKKGDTCYQERVKKGLGVSKILFSGTVGPISTKQILVNEGDFKVAKITDQVSFRRKISRTERR